jgi:hypothetical protein
MAMVRLLGVALVAAAMGGCGGALSGGTGGMGGTGGDGAMTGVSGTTGAGGTAGSPYLGTYTWGDVTVIVQPTGATAGVFSIDVRDPAAPDLSLSFNVFSAATKLYPSDGAYGTSRYGCTGPEIYEFDVRNCADDPGAASIGPGCMLGYFRQSGVSGVYIQADGAQCTIQGGKATLQVPPPQTQIPLPGASSDAAAGDFLLDCLRSDGTHRQLIGKFKIPMDSQFLLC